AYERVRLAAMLCEAAELEHGLCCQYLFAAFSMKRETSEELTPAQVDMVRDWRTALMLVARQEMEHLGYVCNILTALGEAPHLVRPAFPVDPLHYEANVESKLERFSVEAMRRFVLFELPETLSPETTDRLKAVFGDVFDPARYQTLGELYDSISKLMTSCEKRARAAGGTIFIGPPSAQFETGDH